MADFEPWEFWYVGHKTAAYQDVDKVFPPFKALSIGSDSRQVAIIPLDEATMADAQEICRLHNGENTDA